MIAVVVVEAAVEVVPRAAGATPRTRACARFRWRCPSCGDRTGGAEQRRVSECTAAGIASCSGGVCDRVKRRHQVDDVAVCARPTQSLECDPHGARGSARVCAVHAIASAARRVWIAWLAGAATARGRAVLNLGRRLICSPCCARGHPDATCVLPHELPLEPPLERDGRRALDPALILADASVRWHENGFALVGAGLQPCSLRHKPAATRYVCTLHDGSS